MLRPLPPQDVKMTMHRASGRWKLGLALAMVTALCWATLPLALKITLEVVDPITLTWFRFLTAAGIVFAWLAARGGLSVFAGLDRRRWLLLAVAALLLIGNYVFYLLGVFYTTPANAQLLIQLAPLLMAVGGIVVFHERYRPGQWAGLAIIALGLGLFFRDQLSASAVTGRAYALGSAAVIVGAVSWAGYALLQKQLLLRLSSTAILLFIYAAAALLLWPFAHPTHLFALDVRHGLMLGYCALNTLVAYGAFAEALAHWEASRVSAILATTPLLCLAAVAAVHAIAPTVLAPEHVTWLGYVGAGLVVVGSAMSSLLGQRVADAVVDAA